jgi:FtsP/CotA-like multicopper oxidase with cupredoxin domain
LPGDTLVVNLTNNLPVPPAGSAFSNNTNLHYHGLHVSPQAPGDDSIDMLAAPGQSLHYLLQIPLTHPPGLYWYHAHAHAEAERQTLAGMSGALIVDGIAAYTPAVANMTERVLIARDAPLPGSALPSANLKSLYAMKWAMQHGVTMHASSHAASAARVITSADRTEFHAANNRLTRNPYVDVDPRYRHFVRPLATDGHCVVGSPEQPVKALTLNGATQPALQIAPGEQQFWRMVNAGADTYLDVAVDNAQLQVIAIDGVPVSSGVGTPSSLTVSDWVLPPASRVEFIVTGPPAGTPSYLRTNCFDAGSEGDPMPAQILASLTSTASATSPTAKQALHRFVGRVSPRAQRFVFHATGKVRAPRLGRTAAAIRAAGIAATRTLYYTDQNNINGIAYDPAAPPQFYAQSGTVEQWTISNGSNEVHTFHIHQIHFVVQAINGTPLAQQYVMDNVNVPAATANGPGTVTLLLDFTDPTVIGTFLLHCHILSHEDGGMMAKIRVGTAPPLASSVSTLSFAGVSTSAQTVTMSGGTAPYSVSGCAGVAFASVKGSTISVSPFGAGSCVLTVADASNPSLTTTIAIAVTAPPPVIALAPTSTSFAGVTAPAQSVAIVGGFAPFTITGCASIVAATVIGSMLNVAPAAVGTCSLQLTDAQNNVAVLSVAVNSPSSGNPLDDLTFHQNPMRTGWYQNETVLNTTTVASPNFGPLATLTAPAGMPGFGKVYAQPLYVTNETAIDGFQHNLIIVAGAAAQVYAFDETTRTVVWHRDFTNLAAGIRQQLWTDTNCSDVQPDVGIVGTPVIDRNLDAIYVVVATMENGVPYTRLHAIGLGSGVDVLPPAVISASVALATGGTATINSRFNMNRAALLEANGNIYVGLGSHCDAGLAFTHGWMLAFNATTLAQSGSLIDLSNANDGTGNYLGSVWMGGFGPAADAPGNIYFATGNGPFNGTTNFSMSIMKVPGNLNLAAASYFTPIQEALDSESDRDVGSAGVLLLPDQTGPLAHLLVGGGKCSVPAGCYKYILNRDLLGGQQAGNAGAVWSADTAGSMFGGPAYFADATGAQHIVYGSGAPGYPFSTYTLNQSPIGLSIESSANVGRLAGRDAGSTPIVSSNGVTPGTAVVWALKTPANSGGPIYLYAFDALNMGTVLYSGMIGVWNQLPGTVGIGEALISPLVANGFVYVPADGTVMVLGLQGTTPSAKFRHY